MFAISDSFKFTSLCEQNGIRVCYLHQNDFIKTKNIQIRVNSRIPYTGALYGLYDFFSCRIEPKEERQFEYLFPYPQIARNCSDSMRQTVIHPTIILKNQESQGKDIVLEVVLSTDGVEPLYFITADDLTYQARCPLSSLNGCNFKIFNSNHKTTVQHMFPHHWRQTIMIWRGMTKSLVPQ